MSNSMSNSNSAHVLLMMSGSIAAYKACTLISRLTQAGVHVKVACTPSTPNFVGLSTLEGLSGSPVFNDLNAPGQAMAHIDLARWAHLTLVYPASANTLAKFASGIADDAVSTLFLAHEPNASEHPVWIAPAMNHTMWDHPATQRNLATLESWGVQPLTPSEGKHACGELGMGRLMEPEAVIEKVLEHFQSILKGQNKGKIV